MSQYAELVKALRQCGKDLMPGERCKDSCPYGDIALCLPKLKLDAAAAIEELEAEQKKTVTQIFGEEQMAWEGRCKALMYQIADLQAQLPKRGEWVEENRRPRSSQFVCSECHRTAYDPQPTRDKA